MTDGAAAPVQADHRYSAGLLERATTILIVILGVLVALWTALYVVRWYSPTPFMDQWDQLGGPSSFADWFSQHNEHRIALPRLIFLLDEALGGKQLVNLGFNWVMAGMIAVCVTLMAGVDSKLRFATPRMLVLGPALALSYSASQYANFDWGFQVQFFGVYLLGLCAVYCALKSLLPLDHAKAPSSFWLTASAVAVCAATLTMANGVFAGFSVAAYFLFAAGPWRWRLFAGAMVYSACLLGLYLIGFESVGQHTSIWDALAQPLRLLTYFVGVLGAAAQPPYNVVLGAGMLFAATAAFVAVGFRGFPKVETALLAVFGFVALSAFVVALGRSDMAFESSATSRYDTPSLLAVSSLLALAIRTLWSFRTSSRVAGWCAIAVSLLVCATVMLVQPGYQSNFTDRWTGRQIASGSLINGAVHHPDTRFVYPNSILISRRLHLLTQPQKSLFAGPLDELRGAKLSSFSLRQDIACAGVFDEMKRNIADSDTLTAKGWARPGGNPAQAVLLVDEADTVVGVGVTGLLRPDVSRALKDRSALRSGFHATFPLQGVHLGAVRAFALIGTDTICQLEKTHALVSTRVRLAGPPNPQFVSIGSPNDGFENWPIEGGFHTLGPPPVEGFWWGSWAGSDANSGELVWRAMDISAPSTLRVWLATGPSSGGQSLVLRKSNGEVIDRFQFDTTNENWVEVEIDLPASSEPVDIAFVDNGVGWGQWSAVASVRLLPRE
ncbi:MAG: hypothetical protein AAFX02_06875 [Pseudomonadota bacterium]